MMTHELIELTKRINTSGYKAYFAITGGGATFIGGFLSVAGGSNTIMGCNIPYNQAAFDKFIGNQKIDSYCSLDAASKLATASYEECLTLGVPSDIALGIGVTCSLAKNDERIGRKHKVFIVCKGKCVDYLFNYEFPGGVSRATEEDFVKEYIYCVLKLATLNETTFGMHIDKISLL